MNTAKPGSGEAAEPVAPIAIRAGPCSITAKTESVSLCRLAQRQGEDGAEVQALRGRIDRPAQNAAPSWLDAG